MATKIRNHYEWLDANFSQFLANLDIANPEYYKGMIVAHGDKCYSYKQRMEAAGIPFHHGVAIYLLTYIAPYSKQVRDTNKGWVDPINWIILNYPKFKHLLPL